MKLHYCCLLILFVIKVGGVLHDFPSYVNITKCYRYDPKISKCLIKATNDIKPYLIKGIPEIKAPSIDPFVFEKIELQQGTDAVNIKAELINVTVKGLGNYNFSQYDFNPEKMEFHLALTIGPILLEGEYAIVGKLLIAPLEGRGHFNGKIEHCNVSVFHNITLEKRKGRFYAKTDYDKVNLSPSGVSFKLDGLFDGNNRFNEITNKLINDNINELFEDLRPVVEKVISSFVSNTLLSSIEEYIPFDTLYPIS